MKTGKTTSFDYYNFIRVLATICVFLCHTSLFSANYGFSFSLYTFFLNTPAWGGVWMLFVLSGILIGYGYRNGRYELSVKGILGFYIKRILKTLLPTVIFFYLVGIFSFPDFINAYPELIIKIITLQYNGGPGVDGIGATWFVFTLMKLYLVAPFVAMICGLIHKAMKKYGNYVFVLLAVVILFGGIALRYYLIMIKQIDWYTGVYTPAYGNADLFIGGFLINYIDVKPKKKGGILPAFLLCFVAVATVVINSWIIMYGEFTLYTKYFPSVYLALIAISVIIYRHYDFEEHGKITGLFNTVIAAFAGHCFSFYLFHSLVLNRLSLISRYFDGMRPLFIHAKLIVLTALISVLMALAYDLVMDKLRAFLERIIWKKAK